MKAQDTLQDERLAHIEDGHMEPVDPGLKFEDFLLDEQEPEAEGHPKRHVAEYRRRIPAFIVDMAVLAAFGFFLGLAFEGIFARLGNLGRLVGFIIAMAYFVPQDSRLVRGQTLGKRLLKIEVVGHDGDYVSPLRSFMRFVVCAAPLFLYDLNICYGRLNQAVAGYVAFVTLGVGGGILYFAALNRRTRQSLHDIVSETYVVRIGTTGAPTKQVIATAHFVIYGAYLVLVFVGILFIMPKLAQPETYGRLAQVESGLMRLDGVRCVSVVGGGRHIIGGGDRYLNVTLYMSERPKSFEGVINEAAKVVERDYADFRKMGNVAVGAVYGYDIGIYNSNHGYAVSRTPAEWRASINSGVKK